MQVSFVFCIVRTKFHLLCSVQKSMIQRPYIKLKVEDFFQSQSYLPDEVPPLLKKHHDGSIKNLAQILRPKKYILLYKIRGFFTDLRSNSILRSTHLQGAASLLSTICNASWLINIDSIVLT